LAFSKIWVGAISHFSLCGKFRCRIRHPFIRIIFQLAEKKQKERLITLKPPIKRKPNKQKNHQKSISKQGAIFAELCFCKD
jgi:hypothetical protein